MVGQDSAEKWKADGGSIGGKSSRMGLLKSTKIEVIYKI